MNPKTKVRRLTIPFIEGPKFLDGGLQAPAWRRAAKITLLVDQANGKLPANPTDVYCFHDGKSLYAGWRCQDPEISDLKSKRRPIGNALEDDHVRLWLDAVLDHHKQNTWEFMVNPHGSYGRKLGEVNGWGYLDMIGMEAESLIDRKKKCWSAEFRILLSEVGINLSRSNICGFNVGRGFRGKNLYSWVAPDGDVAAGWGFGVLDTGDEALTKRSLKSIERLWKKSQHKDVLPDAPGKYQITNSQVGVSLFGPANQPTLWIGKSDVWDRRLLRPNAPPVSIKELKEAAFGDPEDYVRPGEVGGKAMTSRRIPRRWVELHETRNAWFGAYAFPCPKPAGQIAIGLPFDEAECSVSVREDVELRCLMNRWIKGVNHVTVRQNDKMISLRIYIRPRTNVVVIEGESRNMRGQELWLRVFRHRDTLQAGPAGGGKYDDQYNYMADWPKNKPIDPPVAGHDKTAIWLSQDFPGGKMYPHGFRMVLAGRVAGAQVTRVQVDNMKMNLGTSLGSNPKAVFPVYKWPEIFNAAPGSAATITIKLRDKFRAAFAIATTGDTSRPQSAALRLVQQTLALSPKALWREYLAAKRRDYIGSYRTSLSDIPIAPGMNGGRFCYQDTPPWHATHCFNEMLSCYPAYFIKGLPGDIEPYFEMVESMLPMARHYAREVFDCPGIAFPCYHFPSVTDQLVQIGYYDFSMELTAEVVKPFWMHFLYLADKVFLNKRAYPILRAAADFYAAFVTREQDGYYHVVPTYSAEHWPIVMGFELNRDSQSALTMIKYLLNAAAQAAHILGRDSAQSNRWREIASRLAPYPTAETKRGTVFVDVAGAPYIKNHWNIASHLAAINWGDDITLESPQELINIGRRTAEDYLESLTGRKGYGIQALARLGVWIEGEDVPFISVPKGELYAEKLLQSHSGVIRVFPAVPPRYSGGFENYLAVGAFTVTAEMRRGLVRRVEIISKVGNKCRVVRPWSGRILVEDVKTGSKIPFDLNGNYISFDTKPGRTYRLIGK